jgi:hypothetical protein
MEKQSGLSDDRQIDRPANSPKTSGPINGEENKNSLQVIIKYSTPKRGMEGNIKI